MYLNTTMFLYHHILQVRVTYNSYSHVFDSSYICPITKCEVSFYRFERTKLSFGRLVKIKPLCPLQIFAGVITVLSSNLVQETKTFATLTPRNSLQLIYAQTS